MINKNRYLYYSILPCCLLLIVIGVYAYGWETPGCDPPGCNLPAPINAGPDSQTKAGNLTIEGNLTTGGFTMSTGAGADKVLTTNASGVASWQTPASSAPVSSVFGRTGNVTAASGDYSVGNITGAAPLASPTFTGTVTVPTPTVAGAAATKGYVDGKSPACTFCVAPCDNPWPNYMGALASANFVGYGAYCAGTRTNRTGSINLCCK